MTEQEALNRALVVTLELRALRERYGELSRERRQLVTELSTVHKVSYASIGDAIGTSSPRVHEIIHGPRKRKKALADG